MKLFRIALLLVVVMVLLAASSGPDSRTPTDPKSVTSEQNANAKPVTIEDLFETRSVNGGSWSPDGQEIVFTANTSGRLNLWKVKASGGEPTQLAKSDDRQVSATWSPDGKSVIFEQDHGGNEMYDLYSVPAGGGDPQNLTNTDQISEENALFSHNGKLLALSYKEKTAPVREIAIMDWGTHHVRKLTNEQTKDHFWAARAWSPDDKYVYATRNNAAFTDSDIYRIEMSSGNAQNLTQHQNQIRYGIAEISPDGKLLLISSNEKGGTENVALLDTASRKIRWVTDSGWEAEPSDYSHDGKWITYVVNADGRTTAFLANPAGGNPQAMKMPQGITTFAGNPTTFSPDNKRVLVAHQGSKRPSDLWAYDIAASNPTQLTHSAAKSLDPNQLPQSQLVHYKSFDGTMISAFLWVPFNLKRDVTNPAIVVPHGGPTGQTVDSFSRNAAALATRGYICIAPNVRGSTGYGMKFQKMNYQDLGGGDLQDEVYAVKFLEGTGYVDSKKIGITGGSYGGFMTLMAIGKTPDVWAAAVDLFGILDWRTMLQHEDPFLQEYEKSILGDPEKDKEVYDKTSPITYIRAEKAPLLVLQGENDIRVPKEEAEQVVEILKKEGRTVDVHYYPMEGHGFAKRENQIDALKRTIDWFDKYLKAGNQQAARAAQ